MNRSLIEGEDDAPESDLICYGEVVPLHDEDEDYYDEGNAIIIIFIYYFFRVEDDDSCTCRSYSAS